MISVLFFEAQDSPGWTLDKQEGENDLSLNGLEELDADVAKELAKHTGALNLNGLRSISHEVVFDLLNCL